MLFQLLQAAGLEMAAADATDSLSNAVAPAVQAAAEAVPQQVEQSYSLIQMAAKGGWLMLVLLALSIIAIYIFGKKWWMLHKATQIDRNFMRDIRDYIHEGKIKSAVSLCEKYDSPVARLIEKGIERLGRPLSDIQTAVENTGNVEIARLEKGLPTLATIAGGSPMIGFLGTVLGMVQAFFNMANAGNNVDISLLSSGIYTAMITTVGGLIVGILAYFGYNYLTARISDVMYKMESATIDFMDLLHEPADNEEEK
jgi:biopolymer transport protein ExbB